MRNYLLFDNYKNNSKKIGVIYLNCKKTYIKNKNKLNELKKNIKDEEEHFRNILTSINNDFTTYKSNLSNTDLTQQYKTIINTTDNYYLDKINNINYKIYIQKNESIIFLKILNIIHKHLKNYNFKIKKLNKSLNNIDKNKFKAYIYKVILNKTLYDSKLNNVLDKTLNTDSDTLDTLVKKINNLNNIINKNKIILDKLDLYKKNISKYNISPKNIHLLNIMYNNTLNNQQLFTRKLHLYYSKLDNTTSNLEQNINSLIIPENKTQILSNIDTMIKKEHKTNIVKLLKKKIFKNTHSDYIYKFNDLINKVKILKY